MSGKTPGRIAYRAHAEFFANIDSPGWNHLSESEREAWEAAAQAAIDHDRLNHGNPLAPVPELGAVAYEAAENAPLRQRITDLEDELRQRERDIADYRDALTAMQRERDEACAELARHSDTIARLVSEGNELRAAKAAAEPARMRLEAELQACAAALTSLGNKTADLRALVREILREVELGTLGQHTAAATTRTLARTAAWRERAGIDTITGAGTEHAVAALNAERGGQ